MPADRLRLVVPAEPAAVRQVRDALRRWLLGHADGDRADDAALVASEIVTNAVEAGVDGSTIAVAARLVGMTLYLVVVNELPDRHGTIDLDDLSDPHPATIGSGRGRLAMPGTTAIRGRGLPIVDTLVDWWTLAQDGQAVVRCRMDLSPRSSEQARTDA